MMIFKRSFWPLIYLGNRKSKVILVLALMLVAFSINIPCSAQEHSSIIKKRGGHLAPTEAELDSLPNYCRARMKDSATRARTGEDKVWRSRIGNDFIHVHHYCYALNLINRMRRGIGDPKFLLMEADGNLDYMIKHVHKDFVLLPDIYTMKWFVLTQLGREREGIQCYEKSQYLKARLSKKRSSDN